MPLTAEDVRVLRAQHRAGTLNVRKAATLYGIAAETLRRALRGETWAQVPDAPDAGEEAVEAEASLARLQALIATERERIALPDKILTELSEDNPAKKYL